MDSFEYDIRKDTKDLKLLFVEDDELARDTMQMMLDEFFDTIFVASNGKKGLQVFDDNEIDIIITDINMPKMNGLEMTKEIRKKNKKIPILILSAYNDADYLMKSISYNINGYIRKPVNFEQVEQELKKIAINISLEKEVQEKTHLLQEYQTVVDANSIVSKTDVKGIITYVNQNFCNISEYSKEELLGKPHNIVRHPDNPAETFAQMWHTIKDEKKIWKGVVKNKTKSGKSYYVKSTIKPILDSKGEILEFIALREDITDIMNPKKQLIDTIESMQNPLLVYMKLDEFNIIKELFDIKTIEKIENKLSEIIKEKFPKEFNATKVYQLGDGEFALVLKRENALNDFSIFTQEVKKFQKFIQDEVIDLGDFTYDVALNISISYIDEHLVENAALGIKRLQETKNSFIIANNLVTKENEKIQKNMQTLSMIKTAINGGNIISYFQAIIDNKTQIVSKYESLVRLVNEQGKVISPFFFLDTAKKGKYYTQITQIVLMNSFKALQLTDKDISINLSAIDIELESIREEIFSLLEKHRADTHRVVFELLEDESVKDLTIIQSFISKVKKYGVKIAIDDFGSGYSNFERLLEYQPDILKIDGSLIKNIQDDSYSLSIVKTIVSFAKEQNLQIVAEFVENEAIYNILNQLGIDFSQGYYFAQPKPLEEDLMIGVENEKA